MLIWGHRGGVLAFALCFATPVHAEPGNGVGTQFELVFWQSVTGSDEPALYEAYLQQYPAGTFSALAKVKIANLRKGAEPAVKAPVTSDVVTVPLAAPAVVLSRGQSSDFTSNLSASPPITKAASMADNQTKMSDKATHLADDTALLEELGKSQELTGPTLQSTLAKGNALPLRPVMNDVPDLPLPIVFCSAEQRNAFHETRYKPVMEITRANNAATVAHMQRLQQLYDGFRLVGDTTQMNVVATEASDYQQVAAQVYGIEIAMVKQFQAIMAVPVNACQTATEQ